MQFKFLSIVGLVLALAVGQVQAAFVQFGVVPGNEMHVHQILGLEIAGTFYDITFNEGSFDSVYNATGVTGEFEPTPFTTSSESGVATTAVVDFLNSVRTDTVVINGFTGDVHAETDAYTSWFFIPYWQVLSEETTVLTSSGFYSFGTDDIEKGFDDDSALRDVEGGDFEYHWATFSVTSVAVPEPASLVMWGLGCLGLVGRRLRRNLAQRRLY
jgi:hypothetical protein